MNTQSEEADNSIRNAMSPIKKDFDGRFSVEEVDDDLEEDLENEMGPKSRS